MTHRLRQPNPDSPWGSPLVVGMRYQCECGNAEVINIQAVIDLGVSQEQFVWMVKNLRKDMLLEIQQHIEAAQDVA